MQGNPHSAWRLAEDPGDVRGLEPGDDAQGYRLGLVRRQPGEQGYRALDGNAVQYLVLDHVMVSQDVEAADHRDRRPPGLGPRRVDDPMPADREQPAPELFLAAGEPVQVADHLQPGLAGDVIRIVAPEHAQEPQQPRLQRPPQLKKPGLVARARPGQGIVEHTCVILAIAPVRVAHRRACPGHVSKPGIPAGAVLGRSCRGAGEMVSTVLTDGAKFLVPRKTSRKFTGFLPRCTRKKTWPCYGSA